MLFLGNGKEGMVRKKLKKIFINTLIKISLILNYLVSFGGQFPPGQKEM
jgi:hypothetical protein